jgi:hypothetical protein
MAVIGNAREERHDRPDGVAGLQERPGVLLRRQLARFPVAKGPTLLTLARISVDVEPFNHDMTIRKLASASAHAMQQERPYSKVLTRAPTLWSSKNFRAVLPVGDWPPLPSLARRPRLGNWRSSQPCHQTFGGHVNRVNEMKRRMGKALISIGDWGGVQRVLSKRARDGRPSGTRPGPAQSGWTGQTAK